MSANNPNIEEAVEDGPPKEAQTVHRIRANSSIMQLKKILGKSSQPDAIFWSLCPESAMGQLIED